MIKPTFIFSGQETQTDYSIYAHAPEAAIHPGPWPVLLVLDGDDQFTSAKKAHDTLVAAGTIPPQLLVGIGYGASYAKPANRRVRDYTPVRAHEETTSGGADAFLAFVTGPLWREIERRYPVRSEQRGITGYSLGALFVLHALVQSPPFFTHHLAGSPSIWWGDAAILPQIAARHARSPELVAKLFFSVGEKDSRSMTTDVDRLETQLAALAFRGLEVTTRTFPKKTHFNAIDLTFATGLAALYGPHTD